MNTYDFIITERNKCTEITLNKENSPRVTLFKTNLTEDELNDAKEELLQLQEQYEKDKKKDDYYEKGEQENNNAYKYITFGFPECRVHGIGSSTYKEMLCLLSEDSNDYFDNSGKVYKKISICKVPVEFNLYSSRVPYIKFWNYNSCSSLYSKNINYRQPSLYCYTMLGVQSKDELDFLEDCLKRHLDDINNIIPKNYLNIQYYLINVDDIEQWFINDFPSLYQQHKDGEY